MAWRGVQVIMAERTNELEPEDVQGSSKSISLFSTGVNSSGAPDGCFYKYSLRMSSAATGSLAWRRNLSTSAPVAADCSAMKPFRSVCARVC